MVLAKKELFGFGQFLFCRYCGKIWVSEFWSNDVQKFEWDPNKDRINKKKHNISFELAKRVFAD